MGGEQGTGAVVSIRYFAPAPPLRRLISSYYWFRSDLPAFADLMRAELPQIRFVTTGRALNHFSTGVVRVSCPAQLQGPTLGPVRFTANGPLHVFGIGLLPLGWATLIGLPADELADDMADLSALIGNGALTLHARLQEAPDDLARVALVDQFLLDWMAQAEMAPCWFTRLTDGWLTDSRAPEVDALVAASGMSARSVERLARRLYGASPKLLARKYRCLGAAVQLGNGEVQGWQDLVEGGLFYDQAHVIREFHQFIGMTPARFLAEAAPITRLTIARKKLLPELPPLALFS